jgi:hypothetical protein
MDAGISLAFVKEQVNLIGNDGPKIVDVRFPRPVKCGCENDTRVVIENDKTKVVDGSDAIRVGLAFAGKTAFQEIAHSISATWLQFADDGEFVCLT